MNNRIDVSIGRWWDRMWNVTAGCTEVSEACEHCYARTLHNRFYGHSGAECYAKPWHTINVLEDKFNLPMKTRKPTVWFVCGMSDLFHEDTFGRAISAVFGVAAYCQRHTFIVLTKRAKRMADYLYALEVGADHGFDADYVWPKLAGFVSIPAFCLHEAWKMADCNYGYDDTKVSWPLPNVYLGVTAENQQRLDERAPYIVKLAEAGWKTFISFEPLLGPISSFEHYLYRMAGVIVGGESGPHARPMKDEWAETICQSCFLRGSPAFFMKQMGGFPDARRKAEDIPEHLRIRDLPWVETD